jgi:hypothetical protein
VYQLSSIDITTSQYHNELMRTTITLDDDVHQAADYLARVTGRRLGKVISELARRGLERGHPVRPAGRHRFPTFEVRDGAPMITAARVQRTLEKE